MLNVLLWHFKVLLQRRKKITYEQIVNILADAVYTSFVECRCKKI